MTHEVSFFVKYFSRSAGSLHNGPHCAAYNMRDSNINNMTNEIMLLVSIIN